ncbi:MAG: hypothetical protein WCS30_11090 [Selenomonadaceae bacterium]
MKEINFGIGFVTGRANVCNVINHYYQDMLRQVEKSTQKIHLTIFIAYDTHYQHTPKEDFYKITRECSDQIHIVYITPQMVAGKKRKVMNLFSLKEEKLTPLFGNGHAQGRNIVMYYALVYKIDYLLFGDDDEYPVACIKKQNTISWCRQDNIFLHIAAMQYAEVSIGYHCGYISPIPCFTFDKGLTEVALKRFIDAIGNEIVNWDDIRDKIQKTNGVTFADSSVIKNRLVYEIHSSAGAKWVAGSTLCLNLQHVQKIPVFYNPPRARGEDTFFSLRLNELKVVRVPVYHFHDGFLTCRKIMKGIYPGRLDKIQMDKTRIKKRFFNAALGWLRYKPLFTYLTKHSSYDAIIQKTMMNLKQSHKGMSAVFGQRDFDYLLYTFAENSANVRKHYQEYIMTNKIWNRIKRHIVSSS